MFSRFPQTAALGGLLLLTATACTSTTSAGRASDSTSPGSLKQLADAVQQDVAEVWPRTGRIWPGMDFSDHNLLISNGTSTYAVNAKSTSAVALPELKKQRISVPLAGGFDVVMWQGKKAVIIRPDERAAAERLTQDPTGLTSPDMASYVFELATHEQFHPYVQQGGPHPWPSLKKADAQVGGREEIYPLAAEPRIQRAMIYNSLLAAYKEPARRDEQLAAAAYWHKEWAGQFPEEAQELLATDLLEGTAKYVEKTAVGMAHAADPTNAAQVSDYLASVLKPMKIASKGVEPYAIGAAALLNADAIGLDVKKTLTVEPVTPLSLVLDGVEPSAEQEAPQDVVRGIKDSVAKTNKELAPQIEPFVSAVQDKDTTVLMLPVDKLSGSVGGKGFYTTEELPISITPEARATFTLPSGTVTLNGITAGQLEHDGTGYFAVPLPKGSQQVALTGDRLALTGTRLRGAVTVDTKTEDGQRFLYAR
ncbi:hypothetical protein [Streptomyces mesophilus]|uniref:hypothetical protein n=1 Tax=Streptomyces mesophilus TaxID=1775132 RepID=UPI0033343BEF